MALTGAHHWSVKATAGLLLAVAFACAGACATGGPAQPRRSPAEERLGIRVQSLRIASAGYMLDFRFQVVEPERAGLIMDRAVKPYIIDEASGVKLLIPSSPKVGPMRQTTRKAESGRSYWLLFANPARFVKPGNLMTIVVGDVRLEHIPVR